MKIPLVLKVILILILVATIAGCSKNKQLQNQAQKMLERGNYSRASYLAIASLNLKPDNAHAQATLSEAYHHANQEHLDEIAFLMTRGDDSKWPEIVSEYQALEALQTAVRKLPALRNQDSGQIVRFDLRDYSTELRNARTNSAEYHYQEGIRLSMMSGDRENQKSAAGSFKKAQSYVPNFKDSANLYDVARQKATIRIAIMPFEDKSGSRGRYGAIQEMLADRIISQILQDRQSMEFVDIISRSQTDVLLDEQQLTASGLVNESSAASIGQLLGAQKLLSGKILQLVHNAPKISSSDQTETASIEIEEDMDSRSSEKEISCKIRTFTKTASLQIMASYSLVDVSTGRIKSQDSFSSLVDFEDTWAEVISGDQRALESYQRSLVAKTEPQLPSAGEMANEAIGDLSRKIANHFLSYIQ